MKRYIIGTLILLIFLNTAVLTLFFFLHTRSAFNKLLEQQIADIEQQVTNRLKGFDTLISPFEEEAAQYNEQVNAEIFRKIRMPSFIQQPGISNRRLSEIARAYPAVDVYIIDSSGVVRTSTLTSDIGLDLSSLDAGFTRFLEKIYSSGELATQRLALSNMTGTKMIYTYFSPKGADWILETSVNFEKFIKRRHSDRLYQYLFKQYFTQIEQEHSAIKDFDLIHLTSLSSRSLLSGRIVPITRKTIEALQGKQELQLRSEGFTFFRRYNMESLGYDFVKEAIVRFQYDLSYFQNFMHRLYTISAGVAGGFMLIFSLLTYFWVDRKFVHRIELLKEVMENAAGGNYVPRVTYSSRIPEMHSLAISANQLIETIDKRETALRSTLAERESLLNEIHHRVKNNLNVVISLLNLQADEITTVKDARDAFHSMHNRIHTMAITHEMLYQSERLSQVNIKEYIETFLSRFNQIYGDSENNIQICSTIDDSVIDIAYAVPCGIIINELLTNAYKHAFSNQQEGRIDLVFRRTSDHSHLLQVKDNGIGFEKEPDYPRNPSLGLTLVHTLCEQIGAHMELSGEGGVRCEIRFSTST